MSHSENNRRLVKNSFVLYIRTAIVLIIQLWISRLLLDALGVEGYGAYNVIGSVIILFTFLNRSLTQATQRFLTFELGKGDFIGLSKVFNMSILIQVLIILLVLLLTETIGLWFINNKLVFPEGTETTARIVYQLSILTMCISILRVPLSSLVIAYEKMTAMAYISIIDILLKFAVVIIVLHCGSDKLLLYGALLVIVALLVFLIEYIYVKKKFAVSKISFSWDTKLFKDLLSFSGWSLAGSATSIATQNGFVMMLNIFYGVVVNAAMGIANQVASALAQFVGSFQTSFVPQIVKTYASNDFKYLTLLLNRTSKFSFILIFIPAIIIFVNLPLLLKLWLTEVPEYTVEFCRMMLICSVIDATSGPFNSAVVATGKIRIYQILISLSFLLDLVLSYVLIKSGITPYFILVSRVVTRGIINMIIGMQQSHKLFGFYIGGYLKNVVFPIILVVTICVVVAQFMNNIDSGWILLVVSSISLFFTGFISSYYIILTRNERSYFLNLLGNVINKIRR